MPWQRTIARSMPSIIRMPLRAGDVMIITKSKNCIKCSDKVRLMPLTNEPVSGRRGTIQVKICPQCGEEYIKSRNDLSMLRASAK
jgi:hypothetical protein